MTHRMTYNKSPRRINYKATKSKTNTGTTALERSVEQTTVGFKPLLPNLLGRAILILNFVRRFRNFIADTVPC